MRLVYVNNNQQIINVLVLLNPLFKILEKVLILTFTLFLLLLAAIWLRPLALFFIFSLLENFSEAFVGLIVRFPLKPSLGLLIEQILDVLLFDTVVPWLLLFCQNVEI